MTVGIAIVCEDGKKIICLADKEMDMSGLGFKPKLEKKLNLSPRMLLS